MLTVHVEGRVPRSKEDTDLGGKTGQGMMQSLVLGLRSEASSIRIYVSAE